MQKDDPRTKMHEDDDVPPEVNSTDLDPAMPKAGKKKKKKKKDVKQPPKDGQPSS